jgi:hypothetical protein
MTILSGKRDLIAAAPTAEKVLASSATSYRSEHRSRFVVNPTTGALEVPSDLRLKVIDAIRRDARRYQRRLYLRLPGLYLRKFVLQVRYAALSIASKFGGYLSKFTGNGHRLNS